ncbi:hypothetical protein DL770_010950 [Monosporascus sp. CRB-9-2]|nr:hypothetical protein DL770_010950 [Monosporascus sp. CRB-9-2]
MSAERTINNTTGSQETRTEQPSHAASSMGPGAMRAYQYTEGGIAGFKDAFEKLTREISRLQTQYSVLNCEQVRLMLESGERDEQFRGLGQAAGASACRRCRRRSPRRTAFSGRRGVCWASVR